MRNLTLIFTVGILLTASSCSHPKKPAEAEPFETELEVSINDKSNLPFDSALITPFFKSYPELEKYQNDVVAIYRKYQFNYIWFDKNGIIESGNSLYSKVKGIEEEGISSVFPYHEQVEGIFNGEIENKLTDTQTDLMLSSLFLFYAHKVYKGVDDTTVTAMGWLLPRKHVSYTNLLDSIMLNPELLGRNDQTLFRQYYKLRDILQRYREIEKKGGWNTIDPDPNLKSYKPGDSAQAIRQIRARLFITGDINQNNNSAIYDAELIAGVIKYQLRNGKKADTLITTEHILEMNIPIGELIKKIIVNMERCRWIPPELAKANEFLVVNIPSYKLNLYRDGKSEFECPVVVGASMTKTVIFSGKMSYIVFSPYWYVPQSIIDKDIKPGMAKNKNYLASHNMEWNDGRVRQKPGKNNSLGLVKFIFPNSNSIYLHDTPSKSLFEKESRAFSHGCIRVGKPRDLAITILKEDTAWTPEKIDVAMHAGKEQSYTLKNKIPVHIGYFTAWVDLKGEINFYEDVYQRDERLYQLIMN